MGWVDCYDGIIVCTAVRMVGEVMVCGYDSVPHGVSNGVVFMLQDVKGVGWLRFTVYDLSCMFLNY